MSGFLPLIARYSVSQRSSGSQADRSDRSDRSGQSNRSTRTVSAVEGAEQGERAVRFLDAEGKGRGWSAHSGASASWSLGTENQGPAGTGGQATTVRSRPMRAITLTCGEALRRACLDLVVMLFLEPDGQAAVSLRGVGEHVRPARQALSAPAHEHGVGGVEGASAGVED
ncbi:hypothetical protein ABZY42_21045 [Streptomyces sp. NPDC006622]|uniref:hypothetical protein n=1 Tax=Streptomyces sp. NPDC006622 TaxID=3155459 RepID=UPI0033B96615